jgi:multiple sugar transport system ATP-binding protein
MAELVLTDLRVLFGNVPAVDGVTLTVPTGRRFVILGPSGCGKTTTLRTIAGLERPLSGSIRLGGRDLFGVVPAGRNIAMVFQTPSLYPHMSVRGNLSFGLRSRRIESNVIETRIAETIRALGIGELVDRYPDTLSSGQQSRVAFARAMVQRPDLMLMDEPLTGLDSPLRWQLQNEWLGWHQRFPTTTIHVTHDQDEAMMTGDLIAVMNRGRIEQVGTPSELYSQPANRFVAGFIGSPGMNFATLFASADGERLSGPGLDLPIPQRCKSWGRSRVIDIGVRPEAIVIRRDDTTSKTSMTAERPIVISAIVSSRRPLGSCWLVEAVWGENRWWIKCDDASDLSLGDEVQMETSSESVHYFASSGD